MKKNNQKPETDKQTQQPVEEVRNGLIKAAIWQNETAKGIRYNVTFRRLYKEKGDNKQWKSTSSFGRDDLLVLAKVADQAHTRILELQSQE